MRSKELREIMLKYNIDSLYRDINSSSFAFYSSFYEQEEMRLCAIKKAFNFHYSVNKFYKRVCDKEGFTPLSLKKHEDLTKIPLIPIDYFTNERMEGIMTLPSLYKQIEFHETGLRGEHTKAYRDSYTNDMAIMTIASLFTEMLDSRFNPSPIVVFFTPPIISAPNLGMLRGLGILGSIYADRYYVIDESDEFRFREATDYVSKWLGKLPIYLVGPPFILKYYLEYLKANKINLDFGDTNRIMTIGGVEKS